MQASTKKDAVRTNVLVVQAEARLPQQLRDDVNDGNVETDWHQSDATTAAALVERATAVSSLLQQSRKDVHTNIEAAQAAQKKRYDVKHQTPSFAVECRRHSTAL